MHISSLLLSCLVAFQLTTARPSGNEASLLRADGFLERRAQEGEVAAQESCRTRHEESEAEGEAGQSRRSEGEKKKVKIVVKVPKNVQKKKDNLQVPGKPLTLMSLNLYDVPAYLRAAERADAAAKFLRAMAAAQAHEKAARRRFLPGFVRSKNHDYTYDNVDDYVDVWEGSGKELHYSIFDYDSTTNDKVIHAISPEALSDGPRPSNPLEKRIPERQKP